PVAKFPKEKRPALCRPGRARTISRAWKADRLQPTTERQGPNDVVDDWRGAIRESARARLATGNRRIPPPPATTGPRLGANNCRRLPAIVSVPWAANH